MALVKKSKIVADAAKPAAVSTTPYLRKSVPAQSSRTSPTASAPHHQTIAERVAAATEELASGLAQASAATTELSRSMGQIASGA